MTSRPVPNKQEALSRHWFDLESHTSQRKRVCGLRLCLMFGTVGLRYLRL